MDNLGEIKRNHPLRYLPPNIESHYPNLRAIGYGISSKSTSESLVKYNCVALVADDQTMWWEPSTVNSKPVRKPGRYWPGGIPTDGSVESYVMLFELLGYEQLDISNKSDASRLEILYEKIAIFGYPEEAFSHVAYQLYFGWISKLGDWHDIKHKTLKALESDYYGEVKVIMKKRCSLRGLLSRAFFNQTARMWPVNTRQKIDRALGTYE